MNTERKAMIPDERVIELAKEAAPKQPCEHGYACFDIEELQRFAALIQDEPTDKESLTVEPVAKVLSSEVRPVANGKYHSTVVSDERLSIGAELFTHPAEDAKDAARYRWLRKQHWSESSICVVMHPKNAVRLGHQCPSEERLDDFIDAAIDKVIQEGK